MIPQLKRGVQRSASKQVMEVSLSTLCLSLWPSNKVITRRHSSPQSAGIAVTLPPKCNLELFLNIVPLYYWKLLHWHVRFDEQYKQ